jgi:hypothetical protein
MTPFLGAKLPRSRAPLQLRAACMRVELIDEFVAASDDWTVDEVTQLLGDSSALGEELVAELIALRSPASNSG